MTDNTLIVGRDSDGTLHILDLTTGRIVLTPPTPTTMTTLRPLKDYTVALIADLVMGAGFRATIVDDTTVRVTTEIGKVAVIPELSAEQILIKATYSFADSTLPHARQEFVDGCNRSALVTRFRLVEDAAEVVAEYQVVGSVGVTAAQLMASLRLFVEHTSGAMRVNDAREVLA